MKVEHDPETWMRHARAELGIREAHGAVDNPRVIEYLATTRLPDPMIHDATPWCSAFVNWVFAQAKMARTQSASARSWLSWGVPIDEPRDGCVVVLTRPSGGPGSGHVAFCVGGTEDEILLLGGNQRDSVSQRLYPRARVVGYRWPA